MVLQWPETIRCMYTSLEAFPRLADAVAGAPLLCRQPREQQRMQLLLNCFTTFLQLPPEPPIPNDC